MGSESKTIEESERKFRMLAENLPGAVYLCNNDDSFSMIYLNDRVKEITGYSSQEFINGSVNFPQLYHPDDRDAIYRLVEEKLSAREPFHLIYRIKRKDGILRWVEEFGGGVFIHDKLVYLEGYLQDITDRKEIEKKIVEQNMALVKANEELDRFVYIASHDLRSPLASLLGLINLAAICKSDELDEILRLMRERVTHLDHFIEDITYYSQNARLELEHHKVNLVEIINESIESLKYSAPASNISFQLSIARDFELTTDKRRLKIVLNNLIGNAIKYSDNNKTEKLVRVTGNRMNGKVTIQIIDNGIGIKEEHLPKIFNMFYRASEKSIGSGLGLYIVKETINKMNGEITVTSEPEKGTAFTVTLP